MEHCWCHARQLLVSLGNIVRRTWNWWALLFVWLLSGPTAHYWKTCWGFAESFQLLSDAKNKHTLPRVHSDKTVMTVGTFLHSLFDKKYYKLWDWVPETLWGAQQRPLVVEPVTTTRGDNNYDWCRWSHYWPRVLLLPDLCYRKLWRCLFWYLRSLCSLIGWDIQCIPPITTHASIIL